MASESRLHDRRELLLKLKVDISALKKLHVKRHQLNFLSPVSPPIRNQALKEFFRRRVAGKI